jgi:hypothetical protein
VRRFWAGVAVTLGVIAVTWLLMRLGDVTTELLTRRLLRLNRSVDIMLVRLTNRLGKAMLVTVCALVLLRLSGFDLTAVLTGLGLGGVAIARRKDPRKSDSASDLRQTHLWEIFGRGVFRVVGISGWIHSTANLDRTAFRFLMVNWPR